MQFTETPISGVWIIDPDFHRDERGHFFRAWCVREFEEHGIQFAPLQANMAFNLHKGTVRGMHFQVEPASEAKLIRCTQGAMFDVALDLRSESPTYRKWFSVELTPNNGRMLYVPEGCAHGYQALKDATEMHYMTSQFYASDLARGVRFDDPAFSILWPLKPSTVSAQDRNWPLLEPLVT
jgi:dTDP-4-dehydrorhamnose 3,5-epimerase